MHARWQHCKSLSVLLIVIFSSVIFCQINADENSLNEHDQRTYCFDTNKVTWLNGNNGRVLMRDDKGGLHHIRIKGVSWHGFDTDTYALNGLNETTMESILTELKLQNFNAIRVPISLDFALWRSIRVSAHTDICDDRELSSMQLHRLFLRAAAHGILVMIDLHSLHAKPTSLTRKGFKDRKRTFDLPDLLRAWNGILFDYLVHPNFFALDAFDGPHFSPDWQDGELNYELMLEQLVSLLERGHQSKGVTRWFKGLIGVKPYRDRILNLTDVLDTEKWRRRIVYTPQVTSTRKTGFSQEEISLKIPESLFAEMYGYLEMEHGHAVILTNWEGPRTQDDYLVGFDMDTEAEAQYINIMAEWLRSSGIADIFFNLDPSESGLLQSDWSTFNSCRLELVEMINPFPTLFAHINTDVICISDWGDDSDSDGADYNGLDCLDPSNNYRCIYCNDRHFKTKDLSKDNGGVQENASGDRDCVPWSFYLDLNAVDENDSRLKHLSSKMSRIMNNGAVNRSDLLKVENEVASTVRSLHASRTAIMHQYSDVSTKIAKSLFDEAEALKKLATQTPSRKKKTRRTHHESVRYDL